MLMFSSNDRVGFMAVTLWEQHITASFQLPIVRLLMSKAVKIFSMCTIGTVSPRITITQLLYMIKTYFRET